MRYIAQSTQSVFKKQPEIKLCLDMHHRRTPFTLSTGRNVTRFCVTAAETESRPPAARPPSLCSSRWSKTICSFLAEKKAEVRTVSRKRWDCVPPVMASREGIFPPSLRPPPSFPIPPGLTTPIKSEWTSLTLSRLLENTSPVEFEKANGRYSWTCGERRCGERLRVQQRRCVVGWAGGVEPRVRLRSRFGPGPDYLSLGGPLDPVT